VPTKVAIVDDDPWVRYGRATALVAEGGFDVVQFAPRQAQFLGTGWAGVDVALVDAHDDAKAFDHFPGVGVVEAIRVDGGPATLVVVVSGHLDNTFLRLRMAEAGADYLYRHEEVGDPPSLLEAVTTPSPDHRAAWPDPVELAALGLGPSARPNAALHYLEAEGLLDAFDGQRSQKSLALSRRTIMRARREVGHLAGLSTSTSRDLQAPEWRTVVDFVNRARGVERRGARRPNR
jgi:CheY-like chemotaxis protein